MPTDYDFSGWATKNDMKCSDGRVIRHNAFKDDDGKEVSLVWGHDHTTPDMVLGHALLENRDEGVYCYGKFNDTANGKIAKILVDNGDITALSIYAGGLKQIASDVVHGVIREVSLVHAGANPGAFIDTVIAHSDDYDEEAVIYTGESLELYHADEGKSSKGDSEDDETLGEIFDTLTDKQKNAVYYMMGQLTGESESNKDDSEGGEKEMKHNVFDTEDTKDGVVLSHADQTAILNLAKSSSVGSLRSAIEMFAEKNETFSHGFADGDIDQLFPEYKDVYPGAPELISRDQDWVSKVIQKTHKRPISRIRTRQADIRDEILRAQGYQKGKKKKNQGNIKLLTRSTDPQTVYIKDKLERDDIVDITDFDVVEYQYGIMKQNLYEELARAIMIGDGREEGDEGKISESHIRSIWNDDDLYTIHADVDIEAARKEIQGSDTSVYFGENYIYAEAIVTAALYAREQYKGSGSLDFYCTPHLLNVMLLARDMNGRRIYNSKADLAAALNVGDILKVEQFEGKIRTTSDNKKKKLLGLFVNLADYQVGSTKGGEITRFNQFDIDFNQEKYLIETRVSGALTRVYSAIALEEDVTESATSVSDDE